MPIGKGSQRGEGTRLGTFALLRLGLAHASRSGHCAAGDTWADGDACLAARCGAELRRANVAIFATKRPPRYGVRVGLPTTHAE